MSPEWAVFFLLFGCAFAALVLGFANTVVYAENCREARSRREAESMLRRRDGPAFFVTPPRRNAPTSPSSSLREIRAVTLATYITVFTNQST